MKCDIISLERRRRLCKPYLGSVLKFIFYLGYILLLLGLLSLKIFPSSIFHGEYHCILFASSVESNFLNMHTLLYLQISSDNRLLRNTKIHLDSSYDATLEIGEDEYLEREWFATWVIPV